MEKFYIAEPDSNLFKDYNEYLDASEKVRLIIVEFFKVHGITSTTYYADRARLALVPSPDDSITFLKSLKKGATDGLFFFKANSKIAKAWVKRVQELELKIPCKPLMWDYFTPFYGRISSRVFQINGDVYCSLRTENDEDFETTDKLIEIPGSQFFKTVEDFNAQIKAEAEAKE